MSEQDELRSILDETAAEISRVERNPRPWLAWIIYLLERLEQQATDIDPAYKQSYVEMLTALRDVIKNRLRTGGW